MNGGRVLALLAVALASLAAAYDFARIEQLLRARFGEKPVALLRDWQRLLADTRRTSERDKLGKVNDFINGRIQFDEDQAIWNQSDYWSTPLETIGQGSGDCEDFAILKYYSLKDSGIPIAKLRLVYVKARLSGPAGPYQQAHMVLAYYPTPQAEPLLLDNLDPQIRPASQRPDLQPVFSFNSEAIWSGTAGNAPKGTRGTSQLSRWEDLLDRTRREGID